MKRSGTVLVRNDSRYKPAKRVKSITPKVYTKRTSNKVELKNWYGDTDAFQPDAGTGTVITYGGISQGSDEHDRNGKAIIQLSQDLRIRLDRAVGSAYTNLRIITGIYKQPLKLALAPLTAADILETPAGGAGTWMQSPYATEKLPNFIILGDEYISMPALATGGTLTAGAGTLAPLAETRFIKRSYKYKAQQVYDGSNSGSYQNWVHFQLYITDFTTSSTVQVEWNVVYTDN